jgi:hypothetical protein
VNVPVEEKVPLVVLLVRVAPLSSWLTGLRQRPAARAGAASFPGLPPPYRHGATAATVRAASDYSPAGMKVAYVFSTSGHTASYKLGKMILPQLEQGTHGVEVVGMFFFDDNTYLLRAGDPVGERLGRVAAERGTLLMLCDQCALERCLAEGEVGAARPMGTVAGVRVGCFPDLYAALAGDPPDHVITL